MNTHTPSAAIKVVPSLATDRTTTTQTGLGVDCLGFEKALVNFRVAAHDYTTTNEVLDVKLQESDDDVDGNYVDVSGGAFTQLKAQTVTATSGIGFRMNVNLSIRKRWLRVVATPGGTTPIDSVVIDFILFNPRYTDGISQTGVVSV